MNSLPYEIRLAILESCTDIHSLAALSSTCTNLRSVYLSKKIQLGCSVLKHQLGKLWTGTLILHAMLREQFKDSEAKYMEERWVLDKVVLPRLRAASWEFTPDLGEMEDLFYTTSRLISIRRALLSARSVAYIPPWRIPEIKKLMYLGGILCWCIFNISGFHPENIFEYLGDPEESDYEMDSLEFTNMIASEHCGLDYGGTVDERFHETPMSPYGIFKAFFEARLSKPGDFATNVFDEFFYITDVIDLVEACDACTLTGAAFARDWDGLRKQVKLGIELLNGAGMKFEGKGNCEEDFHGKLSILERMPLGGSDSDYDG